MLSHLHITPAGNLVHQDIKQYSQADLERLKSKGKQWVTSQDFAFGRADGRGGFANLIEDALLIEYGRVEEAKDKDKPKN